MTFFRWILSGKAAALAVAGAVALGVGLAATPNEAAAQCTIIDETINNPIDTFGELGSAISGGASNVPAVDCDDSITSSDIVDGTITSDDLAPGLLDSGGLSANSVTASELADDAVDTAAIQDGAVTQDKIADDAVGADQLQDDAVDTAAIQDGAVTWDKLSSGVRDRIDENTEGVAIALALQNPDLVGRESFGMSVNWGGFDSYSAIGVAATGVAGRDVFGAGDRLAIVGGVGFGVNEGTVGGRIGAQLSW